ITAAVVGVILNLAIWFALHTWFREARHVGGFGFSFDVPIVGAFAPWAILLSTAAMVAIFRFKAGVIATLLACSAAGVLLHLVGVVGVTGQILIHSALALAVMAQVALRRRRGGRQ